MSTPVAVRGTCALVWVDGPDAASFLQGLLSNDVAALPVGDTCRALFLDATGHIQADLRVARTSTDGFTLLTGPDAGIALVALLRRYHFSEDVEIVGPEPAGLVTVIGDAGAVPQADLVLPGAVPGTTDLVGDDADGLIRAAGASEVAEVQLEELRVTSGIPRFGTDFGPANLVQEVGLQDVAVSFDKGCYLGQETVARVAYRGQVNRRLVLIDLADAVPPGVDVAFQDRVVGVVTSVAALPARGAIGLAILRREATEGSAVSAGAVAGTVREPPAADNFITIGT